MATAPSANDLTRQQLDELDALLQRMLSLPLNPPDTSTPAPTASSWRTDLPSPTLATAPRLAAPLPPADLPWALPSESFAFAPEPTVPVLERKVASAAPSVPVRTTPFPPALRPAPAVHEYASPTSPSEPVPFVLWPLVALNRGVDSILGLCGPPGWLLRSGFGKNLLGLVGVGLLGYTAAHLAVQQGWMTLPVPLPWPR